jgi:hypothetical protein
MKNKIKTKPSLVPVKWTDVRFEGLKINHLRIPPGFLHLPQPPRENCDKQRRLRNPARLMLQRLISPSQSEKQIHPDNCFHHKD